MILIADSGSTKCTWLATDGVRTDEFRTPGINAVLHTSKQVHETLAGILVRGFERVYFYGAGCGPQFAEATARLEGLLAEHFATQHVAVESDLVGAARALFGSGEGIACILGTGSNSCHWAGGRIVRNVPPLGYVLGDEGSGAALGRALVNGVFKGGIPLRDEFLTAHGLTYEEVILRVYREPFANRFLASFAPFVREHLGCLEVREMVRRAFGEFVARNLRHYPAGLQVSFVGSVALHFEELLREVIEEEYGLRVGVICGSPAVGLLKYHHGK